MYSQPSYGSPDGRLPVRDFHVVNEPLNHISSFHQEQTALVDNQKVLVWT